MEMRDWEELEKKHCKTLDEMMQRKTFDRADIDVIDKLTHTIKDIRWILSNDMGSSYGHYGNSYDNRMSGGKGGMWSAEGSYGNMDESYGNGRSGMHYVNGHYSRNGEMDPRRVDY